MTQQDKYGISQYILALDQGTTGTTATIVNEEGQVIATSDMDFPQIFPRPGWVEHDPEAIWSTVRETILAVIKKAKLASQQIRGIGITNQRETVVAWNRKTGEALHNAIVWQCRRTTDFCNQLSKNKVQAKYIQSTTGLVIDPYFSGSKIRWLLKNVKGASELAKKGHLAVGTIDSFLLWRFTGGKVHATDVSNASRTQLMNIKTLAWDDRLLKIFSIPKSILPEIRPSSGVFGETHKLDFLIDDIPISGIAGDQQAALFGQTCFGAGEAKCTFGTGSFLLLNTGEKIVRSSKGMLTTVAWQIGKKKPIYALEGGAFICGAAVQWLRDGLGFISESSEVEKLAGSVEDSGGVEFVPALTGMGAPHWNAEARGLICGLTRGTTRAHVARATLEAMALQNAEILLAMQKDLKKKLLGMKVDGGATANNLLMQIQANVLGVPVIRPKVTETTVLGAALLAGLGCGLWASEKELLSLWQKDREFKSEWSKKKITHRLSAWNLAITRTTIS